MKKILVSICPKTLEVTYEVNGVQGSSCMDLTEAFAASNEQKELVYNEGMTCQVEPDYVEDLEG